MPNIVAALFPDFDAADTALRALADAGVPTSETTRFYLNASGQHAQFPIGGDEYADPEAKVGGKGALTGAALGGVAGAALGAVAAPVAGPAAIVGGAAVGAYTGSLAGAVSSLGKGERRPEPQLSRPASVVVAVHAPTAAAQERAASIFRGERARAIEHADGTWQDGTWKDFDPVSIPNWREPPVEDRGA